MFRNGFWRSIRQSWLAPEKTAPIARNCSACADAFSLVLLSAHRARAISAGAQIMVDRDNDKNPVVALREIAEETQGAEDLRERMIAAHQTQIEVDEPEEDAMALLMSAEADRPSVDDMNEERLLRALVEAQAPR